MMDTSNSGHLIRSEVWSSQLKEVLEDALMAQGYVNWLSEFPDGDQFTIPSIGQAQVDDYDENESVRYRALDTGEFTFTIANYKQSGIYITNKNKQDAFYMNQLVAGFVPKMERAIMASLEDNILSLGNTSTSANTINGADHRFVGTGTNEVIAVADFAKALHALKVANVPDTNLIAIVDPSVEYTLNTLSDLVSVANNPKWEGIVADGIASGMRFVKNVYGFDVYTSNHLADANEQVGGAGPTTAAGKQNLFFSAAPDVLPWVGAWRQMPTVDSEYNKDKQRDEYVVTARWGSKLYRPENLVCVLTDTDQV